jgi:NAD(P)H-flavin reductase/hemoglobin-like flavoprotein
VISGRAWLTAAGSEVVSCYDTLTYPFGDIFRYHMVSPRAAVVPSTGQRLKSQSASTPGWLVCPILPASHQPARPPRLLQFASAKAHTGREALDTARIRASFDRIIVPQAEQVARFFYADLFHRHPDVRDMFPIGMADQVKHLTAALAEIIRAVENPDRLAEFLQALGRDHRKFAALPAHYEAVGVSLLSTLRYFAAEHWTDDLGRDWAEAYQLIAKIMTDAAAADAHNPPWWEGEVISSERRGDEISILQVRVDPAMRWIAGQSVAVQLPLAVPRLWRFYSIANAPGGNGDGILEFHVRFTGLVSAALTRKNVTGTAVRTGPPVGSLVWQDTGRDVVMIGGSTGLAPLKAILGHIAALAAPAVPPRVDLVFAARDTDGLYDLDALHKLAEQYDWLTVIPVVTSETPLAEVLAAGQWAGRDCYTAGPSRMTAAVRHQLAGVVTQIRVEDFGWDILDGGEQR